MKITVFISVFVVSGLLVRSRTLSLIPVTGQSVEQVGVEWEVLDDDLGGISGEDNDRQSRTISEIAVPELFSFPVVEQPRGQAGFVSDRPGTLTHFRLADQYGSTGFLAHNYLAGKKFFSLEEGDQLVIDYENSFAQRFKVVSMKRYQAISPNSPYSDFIDLDTNERLSAADLFYEIYGVDDRVVLQTCIKRNGVQTWGRLFVITEPVEFEAATLEEITSSPYWLEPLPTDA